MPNSHRKSNQQHKINLLLAAMVEVCKYLSLMAKQLDAPQEVIDRLEGWQQLLPVHLNLDGEIYTKEEIQSASGQPINSQNQSDNASTSALNGHESAVQS